MTIIGQRMLLPFVMPYLRQVLFVWRRLARKSGIGSHRYNYESVRLQNSLPGWEGLDLRRLRNFRFGPQPEGLDEGATTERAADAVAIVMSECEESLEKFSYGDDCPMQWPGDQIIRLPKLRHLSLGGGEIRPRDLRRWMAEMSSLDRINLHWSWVRDEDSRWIDVFDAIRDHPKGLYVNISPIYKNEFPGYISLRYHTNDSDKIMG